MSADLLVWDPASDLDPLSSHFLSRVEEMAMEEPSKPPTSTIKDFVAELLLRYPDLTDKSDGAATIWTFGPLLAGAHGCMINIHMTWDGYAEAEPYILQIARRLGLSVYDSQDDLVRSHDGRILPLAPQHLGLQGVHGRR